MTALRGGGEPASGTTLGLAYVQAHRDRVTGLVLGLVTTTTRREVTWMTYDMRRFYPHAWERFAAAVPASLRHLPLVDAYATLLADPDPAVHQRAADEWTASDHTQSGITRPAKTTFVDGARRPSEQNLVPQLRFRVEAATPSTLGVPVGRLAVKSKRSATENDGPQGHTGVSLRRTDAPRDGSIRW